MSICAEHGEHTGEVCVPCYSLQQERVERESAPLRYANTAPNLRRRVLAVLAERNGHAQPAAEEAGSPAEGKAD